MNFYEWLFLEKGRAPAGLFSWSHLLSVTLILGAFVALAIILGKRLKGNPKGQWKAFLATTIAILVLVVMKMSFLLATTTDIGNTVLENLPLFFCDMMVFMVPIATFARGRVRDICVDFIAIGGFVMGFMGNYFAGNIYDSHPAFSYLSLISAFSHSLSAFAALFGIVSGQNKMEKRNIPFVIGILFVFMSITLAVDYGTGKNYMFFLGGDGTPFGLIYDWVGGNLIAYQAIIYVLQCGYIGLFYLVYYPIAKWVKARKQNREPA